MDLLAAYYFYLKNETANFIDCVILFTESSNPPAGFQLIVGNLCMPRCTGCGSSLLGEKDFHAHPTIQHHHLVNEKLSGRHPTERSSQVVLHAKMRHWLSNASKGFANMLTLNDISLTQICISSAFLGRTMLT